MSSWFELDAGKLSTGKLQPGESSDRRRPGVNVFFGGFAGTS